MTMFKESLDTEKVLNLIKVKASECEFRHENKSKKALMELYDQIISESIC